MARGHGRVRKAWRKDRRLVWLAAPTLAAGLLLSGCSGGGEETDAMGLGSYTDPGDGCPQIVSAISYADFVLKPLGQEPYQQFTDEVRSRLFAIEGTTALEARDFPSDKVLDQARHTGEVARGAAARGASKTERVRSLREYRREAAQLVLMCAKYVDPQTPQAT